MARKFSSTSVDTTLTAQLTSGATTATVADAEDLLGGVSLGAGDSFIVALSPDTANEEVVVITAVASNSLTITRGQAGTSAKLHESGTTVRHVLTSLELTDFEAIRTNYVDKTTINAKGDLLAGTANDTIGRHAVGTNGQFLTADSTTSTGLNWANGITADGVATLTNKTISGGTVNATTLQQGGVQAVTTTGTQTLTNKTIDYNNNTILNLPSSPTGDTIPSGSVTQYLGTSAPTGWLFCDGSQVSRTTYANLFSVLGTRYGAGNGSTTFTLPDFRDRFLRGATSTGSLSGSTSGSDSHVHTGPAHTHTGPSHTHTISSHTHGSGSHTHSFSGSGTGTSGGPSATSTNSIEDNVPDATITYPSTTHTHSTTISVSGTTGSASGTTDSGGSGNTGSDGTGTTSSSGTGNTGSTSNVPVHFGVNYIVKV